MLGLRRTSCLILIPALAWGLCSASADATSPSPTLRLDEPTAVRLALENTLTIKLGLLRREADRFSLRVARQELGPRIDLQATTGRADSRTQIEDIDPIETDRRTTTSFGPQASWRIPTGGKFAYSWDSSLFLSQYRIDDFRSNPTPAIDTGWTISFSQPLLRGGGLTVGRSNLQEAQIYDRISELNLQSTVIDAVNDVIYAYRDYVKAREAVAISRQSLGRGQRTLEVSRELLDAGRISRSEVTQAQADVADRELTVINAVNSEDASRLTLARLLDQASDVEFAIEVPQNVNRVTANFATAIALAYQNRTDLNASLLDGEAAQLGLEVARNGPGANTSRTVEVPRHPEHPFGI
jgi:outer membrane protein TolC